MLETRVKKNSEDRPHPRGPKAHDAHACEGSLYNLELNVLEQMFLPSLRYIYADSLWLFVIYTEPLENRWIFFKPGKVAGIVRCVEFISEFCCLESLGRSVHYQQLLFEWVLFIARMITYSFPKKSRGSGAKRYRGTAGL